MAHGDSAYGAGEAGMLAVVRKLSIGGKSRFFLPDYTGIVTAFV